MTSIRITGIDSRFDDLTPAEFPPLPIGALVAGTLNLLEESGGLPQPVYLTVSDSQSVDLLFAPDPSSLRAIARWAMRFGGVMTSEPHRGKSGPETWCRVQFDYYGVAVCAFAHIPVCATTL